MKKYIAAFMLFFSSLFLFPRLSLAVPLPEIEAKAFFLLDYQSGVILAAKNADHPLPPASMTKMMSGLIVLDKIRKGEIHWEDQVTISARAASIPETSIPLKAGQKISVRDLFIAMLVRSANNATVALAEYAAGSEEQFIQLMNQRAKQLNMQNTHYVTSTGLDKKDYPDPPDVPGEHVMSAHDSAKLAKAMIDLYPEFLQVTSMSSYTFYQGTSHPYEAKNWNLMLFKGSLYYPGVDGIKTGYTRRAGYCFTGTVMRDGRRLVSVVMATPSERHRFLETKKLFDYGYQNFVPHLFVKKGQAIPYHTRKNLPNAVERSIPIVVSQDLAFPIIKGEENHYKYKLSFKPNLKAPIAKGEIVGYVQVLYKDQPIPGLKPVPIVAQKGAEEASSIRLFFRKAYDWLFA